MPKTTKSKPAKTKQTSSYSHPEADALMRPDVGTQAQFRKKKPPKRYRYDSSLAPELQWDGQNGAREVLKSHLNYVVADTKQWEQSAAYILDTHPAVEAFVKNAGLGFAIPYLHNGQMHDYIPDFIIRLKNKPDHYLILETKGYDENAAIKANAAERWVRAVNADGRHGNWQYAMALRMEEVREKIDKTLISQQGES